MILSISVSALVVEALRFCKSKWAAFPAAFEYAATHWCATVEGQTTAHYIEDSIKNDKIKISKLGQGLPVGGEIEQLDDGTLISAFKNRVPVSNE